MDPVLVWFRRDLRLSDHAALSAAVARGGPVIAVFIHDETVEAMGAAPRFRLGLGIERFAAALAAQGSRLILRRGPALDVLRALVAETGARAVFWSRLHDPAAIARDSVVKAALKADGVEARSFPGHVLFEPQEVLTGQGGSYRVYTPYWRAVRVRPVAAPLPAPGRLPAPVGWPASDALADWQMARAMDRGAAIVAAHAVVGEAAARDRLGDFIARRLARYGAARDMLAEDATSGLSENLAWGEISPAACWHAGMAAMERGNPGAETFLREIVWRDFAHHLAFHAPQILSANWKPEWDAFPWNRDATRPEVLAWQRGRTGMAVVDAGLRQMYVTGRMHNRARMIVASYLTKHLLTHWEVGLRWFADCLTDWDPASNAMGWQWVAGSGPDAAPFFRIFNPETQAEKFDPAGAYRRAWIAEGQRSPPATARAWFEAVPRSWGLSADRPYPVAPVMGAAEGRARALAALAARGAADATENGA